MDKHDQPNILVIMTDEHAPQASEVYGHPYVKTPNLRALADNGVVFDAAYCNSPLCVPSRMAFLTGRPVWSIGVWDNGVPLSSSTPTIAHQLTTNGYETILSGKMHFKGADQRHGFAIRLVDDCCMPDINTPDWDGFPVPSNARARFDEAGPAEDSIANWYDDHVETSALAYLSEYRLSSQRRPFALFTCFNAPHFPLTPRPSFYQQYADITTAPAPPPPNASALHPVHQRLRQYFGLDQVTPEMVQRARSAYFGLVTQTDERVGRLMEHVENLHLARPTVIIYTADHGEMMGEHGLWWKCNFYEEAVRVPLIVSCPDWFPPRREAMPVTLGDLAHTITELSGSRFSTSEGAADSLVPQLRGGSGNPLRSITSEYHAHGVVHSMRMIRQGSYKLNYVVGEEPQLFDLAQDPHEWVDRNNDPAYASIRERLLDLVWQDWPENIESLVRRSQQERRVITAADQTLKNPYSQSWIPIGSE